MNTTETPVTEPAFDTAVATAPEDELSVEMVVKAYMPSGVIAALMTPYIAIQNDTSQVVRNQLFIEEVPISDTAKTQARGPRR